MKTNAKQTVGENLLSNLPGAANGIDSVVRFLAQLQVLSNVKTFSLFLTNLSSWVS